MLAGGAAAAVKAFAVFQAQADDAGLGGISGIQPGSAGKLPFIVADDAVVHGYVQGRELFVDGIGQRADTGASGREIADFPHHFTSLGIPERHASVGGGNRQAGLTGTENIGVRSPVQGIGHFRPFAADNAVAVHQGLGEAFAGRDADVENAVGADLHAQGGTSGNGHILHLLGHQAQADKQQRCGKNKSFSHTISLLRLFQPIPGSPIRVYAWILLRARS